MIIKRSDIVQGKNVCHELLPSLESLNDIKCSIVTSVHAYRTLLLNVSARRTLKAITYSVGDVNIDYLQLTNLIVGARYTKNKLDLPVKYCTNIHLKMYLVYENNKPRFVYIGSWNLAKPQLGDLLFCITNKKYLKQCEIYFDYLWNYL